MAFFQFDNAGFSGGYCFYAVIHTETKKVLNFIVTTKLQTPVPRSQVQKFVRKKATY